jgi:hypothetical protein
MYALPLNHSKPAAHKAGKRFSKRLLAIAVALALSGCAIVSSSRLGTEQDQGATGVVYSLPMARIPVTLSAYQGQIKLELSAPVIRSDPDHVYAIRRVPNPFSSDDVTIDVDPVTGFLTSVSATAKDESLTILEKLLMPKGAVQEADFDEAETLYRAELDPTDAAALKEAADAMTNSLSTFLASKETACLDDSGVCGQYLSLKSLDTAVKLQGKRTASAALAAVAPETRLPPADCSVGICYRQLQPFTLTATLAGRTQSIVVNIPNAAPVLAVPVERHAFVTTTHSLTFDKGALKTATVNRPSSALALISSPLAAASGLLRSVAEPLSALLKLDTSGQYEAKATENTAKTAAQAQVATAAMAADTEKAGALAVITLGTKRGSQNGQLVVGTSPVSAAGASGVPVLPGSNGSGR